MQNFELKDFRKGINLFMKFLIFLMTLAVFIGAVIYFFHGDILVRRGYYLLGTVYAIVFLILGISFEAFRIGIYRGRHLYFYYILALLITNLLNYFVLSLTAKYMLPLLPFVVATTFQAFFALLLYLIAVRIYLIMYPARDCLVIYTGAKWEQEVARKFESFERRYSIKELRSEDEGYEQLCQAIDEHDNIILGLLNLELRQKLMAYCYTHHKRLYVLPSSEDIMVNAASGIQVGDSLVFLIKSKPLHLEQMMIKRLIDLFVSALILLLTLPITLLTALAIKLGDGGPIFFKQDRYTRHSKIFTLLKFRSMIPDAEKDGPKLATPGDDRITPVGRFIRKTRIDEIPQIYNVFKGDMSLVGPRAERLETTDLYTELLPDFAYRLKVKAGITGYAQIYGKYNTSFEDKARMDLYYVENCSILMDLKLLLTTFKVLFSNESTTGFEGADLQHLLDKANRADAAGVAAEEAVASDAESGDEAASAQLVEASQDVESAQPLEPSNLEPSQPLESSDD